MSVSDGKTQQTSRMYFKRKDHKDCYGSFPDEYNNRQPFLFHRGMYMQGKDPDRYDVIWRKKYPDKYFIYTTDGPNDWGGRRGLCYPKEKIVAGFLGGGSECCDGKYWYGNNSIWAEGVNVSSEDRRIYTNRGYQFPFQRWGGSKVSVKGGFTAVDWYYNLWFVKTKDDKYKILGDIDTVTLIGAGSELLPYVTTAPSRLSDTYGRSPYTYLYCTDGNYNLYFRVFDATDGSLSDVVSYAVGAGIATNQYVNGKFLIIYTAMVQGERYRYGVLELNGTSVTRHAMLPIEYYYAHNPRIKYYNGTYYIYTYGTTDYYGQHTIMKIVTTSDFSSYSVHNVPDELVLPHMTDPNDSYTLKLNSNNSMNASVLFPFYQNSKYVENCPDMAFYGSRYAPWTNSAICYIDNPLLQDSANNFFVYSSDDMNSFGFDGQEMARKYYHINGGS